MTLHSLWQIVAQANPYPHYYGLADGALNSYIYAHLQAFEVPSMAVLDREDIPPEQRAWLFELRPDDLFSQWYLQESQGKCWGVVLGCPLKLPALAQHLQQFLTVQDETGRLHWIRAYDPRVLSAYLSVLDDPQRMALFGPQLGWWAERIGFASEIIYYGVEDGHLSSKLMSVAPSNDCCAPGEGQC